MTEQSGSVETKLEAQKDLQTHVGHWLDAIELASENEEDWRKQAKKSYDIYRAEEKKKDEKKAKSFNIFYSNVCTLAPAIYNSSPNPDIRARYGEPSEPAKHVAQCLERACSYGIEKGNLDGVMNAIVLDSCIAGRGVPRIRYEPILVDNPALQDPNLMAQAEMSGIPLEQFLRAIPPKVVGDQKLGYEVVQWDDIRFGPAKTWNELPWLAFKHLMTREQLVSLSPQYGEKVNLDQVVNGCKEDKATEAPTLFKRALVWEIWDKESGEKLFIAKSFKDDFLRREKPEFNIEGFFPVPKPLYAIETSNTLEPVEPYRLYKDLAEELDEITKRLNRLIKALRWRGLTIGSLDVSSKLKDADDGEIVPADNTAEWMAAGKSLDDAIWFMPLEKLIMVVKELYVEREQVKQSIYEVTGIADILRGASNASETLGAQQIKAQWGSLRISKQQKEAERIARDLIRMSAEIYAEKFEPEILGLMTGIQLTPEEVNIMRSDVLRSYKIDVETDSTIQGDMNRTQQNISQFVQGFGSFITSIGPAVQSGMFPIKTAVELLTSFARAFKLGRQAEDALDGLASQIEAQQNQIPPMGQPTIGQPQIGQQQPNIQIVR